ncbi:hypothetical protein JRO89_XS09G0190600 [Xanthoceras sorbifolium]|uniref:Uncharacterized protein n=1 Tax=Xanthoceras sorbifolium TaxID=99658 RepID=A0ABQ8HLX4_9ROSI|nr:hypothetical protein JRO89_XS09G0190600 [Xanthoceras sorbifolium]
MYRTAVSRLKHLKGGIGNLQATRYATSSAVASRPSSPGFFSWLTGEQSSSLPPLDRPLEGVSIPPSLPDFVQPGKFKVTTLHNGVRIASETSANPAASIGLYLDCGSIYETPMSCGASHLLEKMAFKSTKNRSHLRIIREVEAIGGNILASASREQMGYTFDALKTYVPEMVELLVDCVRNPVFLDWEVNEELISVPHLVTASACDVLFHKFQSEKGVAITIWHCHFSLFRLLKMQSELGELRNNPQGLLLEAIHSAGYTGALANPLLAPESVLSSLDGTILEEFVAENYTAPRMVLAASGVDIDELLSIAEPLLSDLPTVSRPVEPKSVYVGGDYRKQADSGSTHVALAFGVPGGWLKEKEAIILTVLQQNDNYGSSADAYGRRWFIFSGRPWKRDALASMCLDGIVGSNDFGNAYSGSDFVSKAVDIAVGELITIATPSKVTQEQLNRAKETTKSAVLMNLESRMIVAEDIELFSNDSLTARVEQPGLWKPVEQFLKVVEGITLNDITNIAQKIISSPLTMASYGDAKITSTSPTGRSLTAEVSPPQPPPSDVRGYPIPRHQVICRAARLVQSRATASSLSDYLSSLSPPLSPAEASEILKFLNCPRLAHTFFHFCPSLSPNFRHDAYTYNRIILILSKSTLPDRFDLVRTLLADMEGSGTRGNISTVNILIGFFGNTDDLNTCMELVKRWDLKMNCYTYKCLLQAYLRSHDAHEAFRVYGEMRRRGYKLDIFAYNMLLDALAKNHKSFVGVYSRVGVGINVCHLEDSSISWICFKGICYYCEKTKGEFRHYKLVREVSTFYEGEHKHLSGRVGKCYTVDQVYKVFEDMKRKYIEPDCYTYTIMIRMTGKIGKVDESIALFDEMLTKGYSLNLVVYNTMIQALANGRMVDKVILLFSKMIERDCRPNEFTYSVILNVLGATGQLGKLDEVVEVSRKYMNKSIYAYLIRTLSQLGYTSEAHRLFCTMWNFHDRGDRDAYTSMLDSLCSTGKTTEAIDLLSKVHEKGINPDSFMYNTVFSALGKLKQISHLHDLYIKMKQDGPLPDIFTYNILIASFGKAGKVDEAVKVFEELENSNCKPDIVSYNSLINCLGKNGNLDGAHMRFKEMQEKGFSPDVVTYSTLIECFGKTDKVEMACRLFDEMLAEGCCPNIVTYNILLDCLERSGRTAEAVDLYAKLKKQGLTPDSITYAILERLQSGSHRKVRVRRQHPITGWVQGWGFQPASTGAAKQVAGQLSQFHNDPTDPRKELAIPGRHIGRPALLSKQQLRL